MLDGFGEDDYVVFDCPGQASDWSQPPVPHVSAARTQIELYSHSTVFRTLADRTRQWGWRRASIPPTDFLVSSP